MLLLLLLFYKTIVKAKSVNILEIQEKKGGRGPLGPSPKSAYGDL